MTQSILNASLSCSMGLILSNEPEYLRYIALKNSIFVVVFDYVFIKDHKLYNKFVILKMGR